MRSKFLSGFTFRQYLHGTAAFSTIVGLTAGLVPYAGEAGGHHTKKFHVRRPRPWRRLFYMLIETAKLNGLDPEAYIAGVIDRMAKDRPSKALDALLPWNF